ncbi:MAG: periplasmic heavy metal sensor [Bryobacteraceae bacterium]|nr:periplasmic heavy metal sensor [Bryobacteraceae bacterium]
MRRFALLFAFAAALCWGQVIDDFPWWDSPIAQNLNLSPEQHKQIQATVREFRDRLIEQRAAVQKAEANLMDLMNEDQVNEAKTREMVEKVVAARSELMRTVSLMSVRLRTVLTREQWQELRRRRAQQLARRPQGPGVRLGLGTEAGPALRPRLQQPLPAARRQLLLQRLRQLDRRLQQQAGQLSPREREEILERLRELEQIVAGEAGPPPRPQVGPERGPAGPPSGQQF